MNTKNLCKKRIDNMSREACVAWASKLMLENVSHNDPIREHLIKRIEALDTLRSLIKYEGEIPF